MQTDRLEDFIKENREAFDQLEPSEKVWKKISKPENKSVKMVSYLLRVAAVFTIAVIITVVVAKTGIFKSEEKTMLTEDPELRELIEAEAFYASQVNEKMDEIRKCYDTFPEIKEEVETDLTELQEMYEVLKVDLKDNISKKEVIEAMIENNRFRLKMVDQVLDQINC